MKKKKDFAEFEELVARFYEKIRADQQYTVSRNVQLLGPDGLRQIDVMLEGKFGPVEIRTIVECKDYKAKVTIQKVDELVSKMQDVKAHKAVLISASGFSRTAIKKADRFGIDLCTIAQALSRKWEPKLDLPILVEELSPIVNFQFVVSLEKGSSLRAPILVNQIDISKAFAAFWELHRDVDLEISPAELRQRLGIYPPYLIFDANTNAPYELARLDISFEIKKDFYFGNLSKLPNTVILENVVNGGANILFEAEEVLKYRENFAKFSLRSEVPNSQAIVVHCVSKPTMIEQQMNYDVTMTGPG